MNWSILFIVVFTLIITRLAMKGLSIDKEIARRKAIKRQHELKRLLGE